MNWLYSVTFKTFSSQPDIPWGIIKTRAVLEEEYDTNLMYVDGYDLTWGGNGDTAQKRDTAKKWGLKINPSIPIEQYAAKLKSEARPDLSNKTIPQLREALGLVSDSWERDYVVPYILGYLDAEEEKAKISAAMYAAYEEDCD